MRRLSTFLTAALVACVLVACSNDRPSAMGTSQGGMAGRFGAAASGGAAGSEGGATASGGASGPAGTHSDGGASASGGTRPGRGGSPSANDASVDGPPSGGTSSGIGGGTNSGGRSGGAGGADELCPFLASLGDDVSSHLRPATTAQRAPAMVHTARLDGTLVLDGQLMSASQRFPAPLDASTGCRVNSSTEPTDVYAIELIGPGPHHLEIDACQSGLLIVNAYQAEDGSPGALDLNASCTHWVASTGHYCGNGYRFVGSGFAAGTLLLAISTLDPMQTYHLELRSSTSCSGPKPVPPVEGDAASTPFVDPNPRACTPQDLGRCNYTTYDPSGGSITWAACCLQGFQQNPEGKCGVTGNQGPCVERMAPGNLDSACPNEELDIASFPPYNIVDKGTGCCNWRTGKCGLLGTVEDLGCVDVGMYGQPSTQICTPDYSKGLNL